jgi:putative tryptophan/tyrosine transport system substrate-binding protein
MKHKAVLVFLVASLLAGCQKKAERLYTFGIFQITDSPTLTAARKSFIQTLAEAGYHDGVNIRLEVRNAMGDVTEAQRIAHEFVTEKVDAIIALSTPCLQASLMATQKIPIIYSAVANPGLLEARGSGERRFHNVTGVSSLGPVREMLALIREVMPGARRIGTLWTPAELNSEYYLRLARETAGQLGLEILAVPVASGNEVLLSAQMLLNQKIDAIFPISDNTINAAFESVGRVAEENGIPLFAGILIGARLGASAAMGWDFTEMGRTTAAIALRVKNGENPDRIPPVAMTRLHLFINLAAARRQGLSFPEAVLKRADEVLDEDPLTQDSEGAALTKPGSPGR